MTSILIGAVAMFAVQIGYSLNTRFVVNGWTLRSAALSAINYLLGLVVLLTAAGQVLQDGLTGHSLIVIAVIAAACFLGEATGTALAAHISRRLAKLVRRG